MIWHLIRDFKFFSTVFLSDEYHSMSEYHAVCTFCSGQLESYFTSFVFLIDCVNANELFTVSFWQLTVVFLSLPNLSQDSSLVAWWYIWLHNLTGDFMKCPIFTRPYFLSKNLIFLSVKVRYIHKISFLVILRLCLSLMNWLLFKCLKFIS